MQGGGISGDAAAVCNASQGGVGWKLGWGAMQCLLALFIRLALKMELEASGPRGLETAIRRSWWDMSPKCYVSSISHPMVGETLLQRRGFYIGLG